MLPTRHSHSLFFIACCLAVCPARAAEPCQRVQDGYSVYCLKNRYWTVEVVPGLGGKVITLRDGQSGREWLWSRQGDRRLTPPDREAGFGAGNLIGWDELLPNLAADTWQGGELPPHGELWSSEVVIDRGAWAEGSIRTEIALASLPLRYSRDIYLDGDTLSFNYHLENTGDEAVPYLWALHPLFAIKDGDTLGLEPQDSKVTLQVAPGLRQLKPGDAFSWPGTDVGLDLTTFELGDVPKAGIKLFMASPEDGAVVLANAASGEALLMRYDVAALPHLAIWLARGVWGGAHHLALEPTNRPGESIEEDVATGWIEPGESREWTLALVNLSKPR